MLGECHISFFILSSLHFPLTLSILGRYSDLGVSANLHISFYPPYTITILLGSVAGISLLVGGIGIMNIMYVSVTERTREIGLRMSVGARGIDILNQFLIEAILLSVTGGIIGVILGVSLSLSLNYFFHIATQIEPWSIIMSFAVCTFTGVFFGWYPAKKAARLDPIEAIRYE